MKATHRDYKHPGHLRVETGQTTRTWSAGAGWFSQRAVCMAPSHSQHSNLERVSLPKWKGDDIVDGVAVPRK